MEYLLTHAMGRKVISNTDRPFCAGKRVPWEMVLESGDEMGHPNGSRNGFAKGVGGSRMRAIQGGEESVLGVRK
jgi:hypothetical protein